MTDREELEELKVKYADVISKYSDSVDKRHACVDEIIALKNERHQYLNALRDIAHHHDANADECMGIAKRALSSGDSNK